MLDAARRPWFSDAVAVISLALAALGLPRSAVKILAVLYLMGKPLTSKELAELTGYSKSTISATIRLLEGRKIVQKIRQGKRDIYSTSVSLSQLLSETHANLLEHIASKIKEIKHKVNSSIDNKLECIENELLYLASKLKR